MTEKSSKRPVLQRSSDLKFMEKYELLMQQKFSFEQQNITKYQQVQQLRRDMLCNIKKLDQVENELREIFGRNHIKRADIRHG